MASLSFHFDYLSPYAYLAWQWVRELCDEYDLELRCEPTVLGILLRHHGHLGPAEIPAKREFVFRDILRLADERGVEIEMPAVHPFNSLTALRVSLPEVAGAQQHAVIDAIWAATWGRGDDVSSPDGLVKALDSAGLDGAALVARTQEPEVKAALKDRMAAAVERGLFGVPTFLIGDELFWGNDQERWLRAFLDGDRGYDEAQLQRFLDTPFGVRRQQ